MADSNVQLHWTDEQWNKVRQVVYEEARRARVAGNVLPLYGPLEPDATYVSKDLVTYDKSPSDTYTKERISVNNQETWPLLTLQIEVFLRGAQVADPELTSALAAFRRAANVLARLEDTIIFNGKPSDDQVELGAAVEQARKAVQKATSELEESAKREWESEVAEKQRELKKKRQEQDELEKQRQEQKGHEKVNRRVAGLQLLPPIWRVTGAETTAGLLDKAGQLMTPSPYPVDRADYRTIPGDGHPDLGEVLVTNISRAIGELEAAGHLGPFACVLDQQFFTAVQTPKPGSMVLPQDRILPFLSGGALLRSSILLKNTGLVVALGGAPIDLVVATDISVRFLQVTLEPRFVFRVYEKIALRVKEQGAIIRL